MVNENLAIHYISQKWLWPQNSKDLRTVFLNIKNFQKFV